MTYPVTDADRALVALWHTPSPPDGHAPMSSMTMPGWMFLYEPGSPEWEQGQKDYDEMYFAAHPDEREKYAYTGP